MPSDPYQRLASKLEDAIDCVEAAKEIRDDENIEQFGDLTLIATELRQLYQRASTTRFKVPG